MHNEDIYNLYPSLNVPQMTKLRRIRWGGGYVAHKENNRNAYRVLVRKPGRKENALRSLTCRWEDGTKMDLEETALEVVDLIHVGQERDKWLGHVNMVMNI